MKLLKPINDLGNENIFLSIVIPSLNEEITIEKFIDWCFEGINSSKIKGEILIIDSSIDNTAELALKKGARVLKTPKRGLGRAYIDSIKFIRGEYILMGDCDLTYDFRNINDFVKNFKSGVDFVMGSRFRGYIEPNSMPKLHRYFGTPLTTYLLNFIYRTKFSDIHCGMRGISKKALMKINLKSQGWEYASEMIVKAIRLNLSTAEVPVRFYKDPPGRYSHHVRSGFWSPWYAGWINLKVMFVYTLDSFMLKPSILFLIIGLLLFFHSIYEASFNNQYQFGMTSASFVFILLSQQLFFTSILVRLQHNYRKGFEKMLLKKLTYDLGVGLASIVSIFSLMFFTFYFLKYYATNQTSNIYFATIFFFIFVFFVLFGLFTIFLELIRNQK